MILEIHEPAERAVESRAVLVKDFRKDIRLELVEHDVNDVLCGRELIDLCRRLNPPGTGGRGTRAAGDRANQLHTEEHERGERGNSADGTKENGRKQQHRRERRSFIRAARRVLRQVDLAARQHAVVGVPQVSLAPQHQPECEQHRRVHPRRRSPTEARARTRCRRG